MYTIAVPNNKNNRKITLAILANFAGIEAEFSCEKCAASIVLTTDSPATYTAAVAAFEDEPCAP